MLGESLASFKIDKMASSQDFYEILGISKNAAAEEIKKAYRRQALKWHPDKHSGSSKKNAEQKFKEINRAYEVLRDPQKRQTYDQLGRSAFEQGGFGSAGGPFGQAGGFHQGPFTYTYSTGGNVNFEDLFGGFSDPFEIFEQFFGGRSSPFGRRTQQRNIYRIAIDFMEAVKGVEKQVSIDGKNKKIKIPAGVDDGMRIRFSDFDIAVSVKPHDIFKRRGQDIIVEHPISFSQSALGTTVEVPTIGGRVKLKVRPGTQPNTLVRLRGQGIQYPRSSARGDQYVRFTVEVPKNLSRRQREILEEFERG